LLWLHALYALWKNERECMLVFEVKLLKHLTDLVYIKNLTKERLI
jgi:hypothetical protein